jgi:hypothetical protein
MPMAHYALHITHHAFMLHALRNALYHYALRTLSGSVHTGLGSMPMAQSSLLALRRGPLPNARSKSGSERAPSYSSGSNSLRIWMPVFVPAPDDTHMWLFASEHYLVQ